MSVIINKRTIAIWQALLFTFDEQDPIKREIYSCIFLAYKTLAHGGRYYNLHLPVSILYSRVISRDTERAIHSLSSF
jgi:hypothetical protein